MNAVARARVLQDLTDHAVYLATDDAQVAERFLDAFETTLERLEQMPYIGVAVPLDNPALFGLRRWPIKGFEKYVILYLVLEDNRHYRV